MPPSPRRKEAPANSGLEHSQKRKIVTRLDNIKIADPPLFGDAAISPTYDTLENFLLPTKIEKRIKMESSFETTKKLPEKSPVKYVENTNSTDNISQFTKGDQPGQSSKVTLIKSPNIKVSKGNRSDSEQPRHPPEGLVKKILGVM